MILSKLIDKLLELEERFYGFVNTYVTIDGTTYKVTGVKLKNVDQPVVKGVAPHVELEVKEM